MSCTSTYLRLGMIGLLLALPTTPATAAETATFELTLEVTWSAATTPWEFPSNAHLSRIIGVTHNSRYTLFRDGLTASSGLELVAENGRGSILDAEFAEARRKRRVGPVFAGPDLASVPGTVSTVFEATSAHPLLSFVTMLAPSPDWFTGAGDIRLLADGAWIDQIEVPLWVWDCGTDDGTTYDAPNADTQPRQSIRLLATPHVLSSDRLVPAGVARIRRRS